MMSICNFPLPLLQSFAIFCDLLLLQQLQRWSALSDLKLQMHSILISLSSLSTSSQHCRLTIWKQLVELTISIWWQDPNNLTYTGTRILDLVYSELLLSTKNQAKTPKSLCILCPRVLPYLSCFERLHNHILFLCPHLCSPLLTIECAKSDPKSSLWSFDP